MVLPGQTEIEISLLKVLVEIGGQGRPRDIYPLVAKKFSQLTEEDVLKTLPSGRNKWANIIHWTRLRLVKKGDMNSPSHGIWAITNKGRDRAKE